MRDPIGMTRAEAAHEAALARMKLVWLITPTELSFDEWMDDLRETGAIADFFEPEDRNPGFTNRERGWRR